MVRNASSDYVYSAITRQDNDHFTIPIAATGNTSGDDAAWIPAFSASISETSGDITAATIISPGALSGSAQLMSATFFSTTQDTNYAITLPNGSIKEGAGPLSNLSMARFPVVNARTVSGTNASTIVGFNYNIVSATPYIINLTSVSTFDNTIVTVYTL